MGPLMRFEPHAYAALRIVAGFLFLFHGLQKLLGVFGGTAVPLPTQRGLAGLVETIGGTLVATGLFAAPAAFIASGEMAVAYFQVHLPRGFWPIQNGGELAALYCFLFLYTATRGSGIASLDATLRRRRR